VRQALSHTFAGVLINPALGHREQPRNLFDSEQLIELLFEIGAVVQNCESCFHLILIMSGPANNEESQMTPKVTDFMQLRSWFCVRGFVGR
jgi:hypothetical protein